MYTYLLQIATNCTWFTKVLFTILLPTWDFTSVKSTYTTVVVKLFTIPRSPIILPNIL